MTAGSVALVAFPFSAREPQPFKNRPVLVVAAFGTPPDQVVLTVMITSNERRVARPGPGDIRIEAWQEAGLALPSVIRTRRLWTAEQRDMGRVLGRVDATVLDGVRDAIRAMLA